MLEILIISAIITARLHAKDRMRAKQGLPPASNPLVEAWVARQNRKRAAAGKPVVKPAKYGMWRYFWQRWQALWETLAQQHRIQHEANLKARAEALRNGTPAPAKPTLKERINSAWQWVTDNVIAPVGERRPERAAPATTADSQPPADGPVISCAVCGAVLIDNDGGWDHPAGSSCPKAEPLPPTQPPPPYPGDNYPSVPAATTQPGVTQPNPEGDPMTASAPSTQQSGEVVSLMSAINYADAVAAAHAAHSLGGGEQYRSSLGQAQVGPVTIASAADAQEKSEIAAGAWRAHAAKLREQLAAKEATTAETGTKEFLLND